LVFYRDQKSEQKVWAGPKPGEVWASEGNEVKVNIKLDPAEVEKTNIYSAGLLGFGLGVLSTLLIGWLFVRRRFH